MKKIIFFSLIIIVTLSSFQKKKKCAKKVSKPTSTVIAVPTCVQILIKNFTTEEKQNPPRKIYSYSYNGKTVYYVPPICCDFFSDVYDSACKIIGHPDGGFTGKGDMQMTDFNKTKTKEKLIWEDVRK